MSIFSGKTAVISGGAGGIGLAIAKNLGQEGMKMVLADISESDLANAKTELEALGIEVMAARLDVTSEEQWQTLAQQVVERFGKVHMLVNNAGVGGIPNTIEATDSTTWQWVMDVNVNGVLYGTKAFVPLMKSHGEDSWLLNVASMAGMGGAPYAGAYTASKAAVVAMSESWAAELMKKTKVHVSVLCPAFVKTRIHESDRNRQSQYESDDKADKPANTKGVERATKAVEGGIDAALVGERVKEALLSKQLYIFTHPNYKPATDFRSKLIGLAFDDAAQSPAVGHLVGEEITGI